jgi:hypothetical protein
MTAKAINAAEKEMKNRSRPGVPGGLDSIDVG